MSATSKRVIKWRMRLKALLIELWGGKCQSCGYVGHPSAFDFHHVDPSTKSFNISIGGLTRSKFKSYEEAKKCVLLCANCHREVEAGARKCPDLITPLPLPDKKLQG